MNKCLQCGKETYASKYFCSIDCELAYTDKLNSKKCECCGEKVNYPTKNPIDGNYVYLCAGCVEGYNEQGW
jgi:hypothetical protein